MVRPPYERSFRVILLSRYQGKNQEVKEIESWDWMLGIRYWVLGIGYWSYGIPRVVKVNPKSKIRNRLG
jgi:hypothetical protein